MEKHTNIAGQMKLKTIQPDVTMPFNEWARYVRDQSNLGRGVSLNHSNNANQISQLKWTSQSK